MVSYSEIQQIYSKKKMSFACLSEPIEQIAIDIFLNSIKPSYIFSVATCSINMDKAMIEKITEIELYKLLIK